MSDPYLIEGCKTLMEDFWEHFYPEGWNGNECVPNIVVEEEPTKLMGTEKSGVVLMGEKTESENHKVADASHSKTRNRGLKHKLQEMAERKGTSEYLRCKDEDTKLVFWFVPFAQYETGLLTDWRSLKEFKE